MAKWYKQIPLSAGLIICGPPHLWWLYAALANTSRLTTHLISRLIWNSFFVSYVQPSRKARKQYLPLQSNDIACRAPMSITVTSGIRRACGGKNCSRAYQKIKDPPLELGACTWRRSAAGNDPLLPMLYYISSLFKRFSLVITLKSRYLDFSFLKQALAHFGHTERSLLSSHWLPILAVLKV